jgi:hypothetical protein
MSIQLNRTQRREMKKLAASVDRITQADARFFERFPHRKHRVRLASQAELAQNEIINGGPVFLPPGCRFFVAVRNFAPRARLRLFVRGLEVSETDLDEVTARAVYEWASTEETRQIEAELRKVLEGRAS